MQTWMIPRHFPRQVAVKAELDYIKREDWPDHLGGRWFRVISTGISVGVDRMVISKQQETLNDAELRLFSYFENVIETILLPTETIWWSLFGMCVNSSQFPGNMGSYIRWYFSGWCTYPTPVVCRICWTRQVVPNPSSSSLSQSCLVKLFWGALHSTGQWVKANLYGYIYIYI